MTEATLFALLHLLVFAYWLGGDIGVFYSSFLLTDENRPVDGRLTAATILNAVDLVPRFALLLALPTGLALADAKGWLNLPGPAVATAFAASALWAFLVWRLHRGPSAKDLKNLDFALRLGFLAGLVLAGAAGLAGTIALPDFIAAKCLILAFCVAMGICVRVTLAPFGPALTKLVSRASDAESDRAMRMSIGRARPFVILIWIALLVAAWLGLATPQ